MFAAAFTLWGSPVTWLEIAACVLAVWMVLANLRVHIVAWPLAIISSLLYALLFADSKLYGEAALQLLFVALAAWGWTQWRRGERASGKAPLAVRHLSPRGRVLAAACTLACWPALGMLLRHVTDSDVPWLDALPTVASVTGQVLLARKFVDNWPVWVGVNVASVGLFAYKGLWPTVLLYGVFTLLACAGWCAWTLLARQAAA